MTSSATDSGETTTRKKKRSSQQGGSWKTLVFLILAAAGMAVWNAYSTKRDIAIATGRADDRQKEFFIDAADRPDIATLYKSMTGKQRVAVANNIGLQAETNAARYYPCYSALAETFGLEDEAKLAKLVGVLLTDFDPKAREALTRALCKIAVAEPAAVAVELKNAGSFQSLGVFTALKALGDPGIPYVVAELSNGDARPQAVEFLVEAGRVSIAPLLEQLKSDNKDVRLAAVDALGKLRAREATDLLTEQYGKAPNDEKLHYLTALGSIGDPRTEKILSDALDDDTLDASMKEQAALGLGRMATVTSVAKLWSLLPNPDQDLTESTIAALQLAGDASLQAQSGSIDLRVRVASAIHSPMADGVLREAFRSTDRALVKIAIRTAARRPALALDVADLLRRLNAADDGDVIDAAVTALMSTPEGRSAIKPLESVPVIGAFEKRRRELAKLQG